jgi:hypothetical protein
MLSHRDGTHRNTFTHTHTFIQRSFYAEQLYTQIPSHTEVLLQRNGFTRGAFIYGCFCTGILCMISDGGHAFRATRVQQADVKPHFHRSFWRSRRISRERVDPAKVHIAISFQVFVINISCQRVANCGHQSRLPCRPKRYLRRTLLLVRVFTLRS